LLFGFRIIPDRGTWLECQFDQHDLLNVYLDRVIADGSSSSRRFSVLSVR